MNWTGGSLQRSKANPKGVLQKQKAHFARARIHLQHGPHSISPRCPGISDNDHLDERIHPRDAEPVQDSSHLPRAHAPPREQPSRRPEKRRNEAAPDAEERLLEKRRRRLLQQNDWAGLARAKPAGLTFRSAEEKKLIGKRRKLKDHHKRAVKKRSESPLRQHQTENGNRCGTYMMSGALPVQDISIRFGSDALTSVVPREALSGASSSSEEMLFDTEAMPPEGILPYTRSDNPERILSCTSSGHGDNPFVRVREPSEEMLFDTEAMYKEPSPLPSQSSHGDNASLGVHEPDMWVEDLRRTSADRDQASGVFEKTDVDGINPHAPAEGCYLAQRLGGFAQPLRLVYDGTSDHSASVQADASEGHIIGETSHERTPNDARLNERGIGFQPSGVNNDLNTDQVRRSRIDDDDLWRSFLPNSNAGSSMSTDWDARATAGLAHCPMPQDARQMKQTPAAWSQHATRGNQTHRSSSVSSSLPSITRFSERESTDCRAYLDERGTRRDDYEATRQRHPSSEHGQMFEDEACAAERTFSSTPFRATRTTICVSDSVQDAASRARAPLSTSSGSMIARMASSAAFLHSRMSCSEDENGVDAGWRSSPQRSGVTLASIQNKPSHDTNSSPLRLYGECAAQPRPSRSHAPRGGSRWESRMPGVAWRRDSTAEYRIPAVSDE